MYTYHTVPPSLKEYGHTCTLVYLYQVSINSQCIGSTECHRFSVCVCLFVCDVVACQLSKFELVKFNIVNTTKLVPNVICMYIHAFLCSTFCLSINLHVIKHYLGSINENLNAFMLSLRHCLYRQHELTVEGDNKAFLLSQLMI